MEVITLLLLSALFTTTTAQDDGTYIITDISTGLTTISTTAVTANSILATTGPSTAPTNAPTTAPTTGPTTAPTTGLTTGPTTGPTTAPTRGQTTTLSTLSTLPTKEPTITPEATTTPLLCLNGGSVIDGICICPDEWTGETCSQANFCPARKLHGLHFPQTLIGQFGYSTELCESGYPNVGMSKASARCLKMFASAAFGPPQFMRCTLTFAHIDVLSLASMEQRHQVATSTQMLTSRPQSLTAENISAAAQITTRILSLDVTEDIAAAAITTVSQLLSARVEQFPDDDTVNRLTETLQDFSLGQNHKLVQPNLVVQSLQISSRLTKVVQLTVLAGQTDTFAANRIQVNAHASDLSERGVPDVQIAVMLSEGQGDQDTNVSVGFVLYENDFLFRSRTFQRPLGSNRKVMSVNMGGSIVLEGVDFQLPPRTVSNTTLRDFACVYWDYEMRDWSTRGCSKVLNSSSDQLRCRCNHTTNFAILVTVQDDLQYSEALNVMSIIGCSLSVVGLSVTIFFQIFTRKSRGRSPTLLLVSICVCMTIFYLLFLFGIDNPEPEVPEVPEENVFPPSELHQEPDHGPCTAVAALLQYFLLATFTWNTLYAAHVFLLFRKAIAGPPQWFFRFSLLTGWGVPALVVAISLATTYRVSSPLGYRQEEFCWLAALDREGHFDAKKPMLWGFLMPLGVMLCFNIFLLVYFSYTTCKVNPIISSTRETPLKKKILSSFSLAVVLGISWILGYFLLLPGNDDTLHKILSVAFCVCNTTQGFQIFILFTVRTNHFKKAVPAFLDSLTTPLGQKASSLWTHSQKYTKEVNDTYVSNQPPTIITEDTKRPIP